MAIVLAKSRNAVLAQLVRNPLIFIIRCSGRDESAELLCCNGSTDLRVCYRHRASYFGRFLTGAAAK